MSLGHRVLCDVARAQHTPIEERGIGFLPQRSALFSHLTVAQNVAFGQPDATVVKELLRTFELDAWAQRRPGSLSAGEQQRVSLARALAARPEALILDEPLSALDVTSRAETRRALGETLRAAAKPTLLITHDPLDVIELTDRVIVLENGRITQQGTPETLQAAPATAFVSAFVAAASHRH